MKLNIQEVPFSIKGSYFAINILDGMMVLKDIHGGHETPSVIFNIEIEGYTNILQSEFQKNYDLDVTETELICRKKRDAESYFRCTFTQTGGIHVQIKGIQVSFTAEYFMYNTFYEVCDKQYELISYKKDQRYSLDVLAGDICYEASWSRIENKKIKFTNQKLVQSEFIMEYYKAVKPTFDSRLTYEENVRENQESLAVFRSRFSQMDDSKESLLATYLLWANQVRAEGMLKEDVIVMSKNKMQNIWSWDNCFSALALAKVDPDLAYSQFKVFIDYQTPEGAFPDFINDKTVSYSCVKPPIHAWAYNELMSINPYFLQNEKLKLIYQGISENTNYWLEHRKHPTTGLLYYSHGNDSGWDNSSVFHEGLPVSSPDLISFLALQCQILSEWASRLSLDNTEWLTKAKELTGLLYETYYGSDQQQFIAINARTSEKIQENGSLLLQMPFFAHRILPPKVVNTLADNIMKNFVTKFGISTERIDSKLYEEDGYWLGPIWAPVTYMLIQSFYHAGFVDEAKELQSRYMDLAKIGGMAENYNALTGIGNDDLGFAWASAVFMLLKEANYTYPNEMRDEG